MATPYLGLDDTAIGMFKRDRVDSNTQKIENALYKKRMDLPDSIQLGSDWYTIPSAQKDWEEYTADISGNKVVKHGKWAFIEMQFRAKRAIAIGASGNITNIHIASLDKGYWPANRIALTGLNSNLDAVIEMSPSGNCYITAYNFTSTTIPKGELLRIGGKYLYKP